MLPAVPPPSRRVNTRRDVGAPPLRTQCPGASAGTTAVCAHFLLKRGRRPRFACCPAAQMYAADQTGRKKSFREHPGVRAGVFAARPSRKRRLPLNVLGCSVAREVAAAAATETAAIPGFVSPCGCLRCGTPRAKKVWCPVVLRPRATAFFSPLLAFPAAFPLTPVGGAAPPLAAAARSALFSFLPPGSHEAAHACAACVKAPWAPGVKTRDGGRRMAAPLGAAVCLEGWCIFLKHPPSAYASARTSNLNASAGIVVHASRPSRISSPNPLQATEQNVALFC